MGVKIPRNAFLIAVVLAALLSSIGLTYRAAAQDFYAIIGEVVDESGGAISGAGAWLCPETNPGCSETWHIARTNEQGQFILSSASEPLVLSVSDPTSGRRFYYREGAEGNLSWTAQNLTVFRPEDGHWRPVRVILPPKITVTGTVHRWDGNPDSGVVATICSRTDVGICAVSVTDETGTYKHELHRGDYQLHFEGGGLSGSYRSGASGNYTPHSSQATIWRVRESSTTSPAVRRLRPLNDRIQPIMVRMLYDDGRPANTDADIRFCEDECVTAQRLPDHRFVEQVQPGSYAVSVWLGEELVGYYDTASAGNFSAGGVSRTEVSSPVHSSSPLEIVLPSRTSVQGLILDGLGEPVAGAHVALCPISLYHGCAANRTDEQGDFLLAQLHGEHYVTIVPPDGSYGFYAEGMPGNFTSDRSQASTVVLSLAPPEAFSITLPKSKVLRIRLLEPDGRPVTDGFPNFQLCQFEAETFCFSGISRERRRDRSTSA